MELNIYNQVKNHEEEKEGKIESQIKQQETAIKQIEKDILTQEEMLKKRLADRQKSKDVSRSMSINQNQANQSLSLTMNYIKNINHGNDLEGNYNGGNINNSAHASSTNLSQKEAISIQSRKHGILQKMNSSITYGKVNSSYSLSKVNGNLLTGSSNIMGGGGDRIGSKVNSVTTNGQGLASRIGSALSKVVQKNNTIVNDDEEVTDLLQLIDELNQSRDLNIKLKSQAKICKMLDNNDDALQFETNVEGAPI